jgi:polyhydroxybutyrate depolymerase
MHDPEIEHQSSHKLRRIFALAGIGISLLLILGLAAFSVHAAMDPGSNLQRPTPGSSNTIIVHLQNTCKTPPHQAGNDTLTIHSGGLSRTLIVHLAPSYGSQPQALVINYHGYNNTALRTAQRTNMGAVADKAGFILIFPQGVDNPPSWNAGIGAFGPTGDADDVQFTRDIINYFEHNYCVDAHRIYVTGYSLGGGMAYRIACTLSDQIAAFATVAGAYYRIPGGCNLTRPVPLLEIHGQADQFAPYNGNSYMGMSAVQTYLNSWLTRDKCKPANQIIFQKADVTGLEWPDCANGAVIQEYRISDGGHVWPGSNPTLGIGYNSPVIDASAVIWNFFSQFSN